MIIENNKITAEIGKVFRRISDGLLCGKEIYLGYTYRINDILLKEPLLELPEHFEEIDDPMYYKGLSDEEIQALIASGSIIFDPELPGYVEVVQDIEPTE